MALIPIKMVFSYPPIPWRNFDYCAYRDDWGGDCSPYGYGETAGEAISDLLDELEVDLRCMEWRGDIVMAEVDGLDD